MNGTLKSLIKENILNRAYHNVYVFRFSQYGGLGTLDLIGKKIRPNDSFYESLESSASAWSLISQIPTVVTYMTTGKSKWYNTGYGSIDFVHYSKTDEKPRTICLLYTSLDMYDPDGVPVIAYFFPNGYGTKTNDNGCSNVIASLYGRDNFTCLLYTSGGYYHQEPSRICRFLWKGYWM